VIALDNLAILLATALPIMIAPGPALIALAGFGAAYGVRRAYPICIGFNLGMMCVLAAVASGLTGLIASVPGVLPILSVLAIVYVGYLAWRIATAPIITRDENESRPAMRSGVEGFVLAVTNPKGYAAMATAFTATTLVADDPLADAGAKAAVISVAIWVINSAWLAVGSVFARSLSNARTGRWMNIGFAVMLLVSVAVLVVTHLQ